MDCYISSLYRSGGIFVRVIGSPGVEPQKSGSLLVILLTPLTVHSARLLGQPGIDRTWCGKMEKSELAKLENSRMFQRWTLGLRTFGQETPKLRVLDSIEL